MPEATLLPRLRYVEAVPVEYQDDLYIYLSDPQNIAPRPLILTPQEFFIASLLDGQHDHSRIRIAFAEKFGGLLIDGSQIDRLIDNLRENLYLDTPEFAQRFDNMRRDFLTADVREHRFAGLSYEEEPQKLREQLQLFYQHPDGAGLPEPNGALQKNSGQLTILMVPHIDLRVGGPCYTHAYRHLAENFEADLFVILGIAHQGSNGFFTASRKDFTTPFGQIPTDGKFLDRWTSLADYDFAADDWCHRSEHSIEFQLPFLQQLQQTDFEIVPVLCGPIEPLLGSLENGGKPHPAMNQIDALAGALKAEKRRTVVILSVDLAHVGPKFGDMEKISGELAEKHREADYRLFETLANWDQDAFLQLVKSDLLPRRVDACSPLLAMLRMFPQGRGRLLSYGQNFQPDTASMVTYGSMVFEVE